MPQVPTSPRRWLLSKPSRLRSSGHIRNQGELRGTWIPQLAVHQPILKHKVCAITLGCTERAGPIQKFLELRNFRVKKLRLTEGIKKSLRGDTGAHNWRDRRQIWANVRILVGEGSKPGGGGTTSQAGIGTISTLSWEAT